MNTPERFSQTMQTAVAQLLRPLFRLLLRNGMSFGAFEEIAKNTFVDVALHEFSIPGKKPSISRASVLPGLSRKEVQPLITEPVLPDANSLERHNRAARVITGWIRDPELLNANRQPRTLEAQGPVSFETLVTRHSGDIPTRAVLDELVRVGAVHRREDGRFDLLVRAYVPQKGVDEKFAILGADVADLVTTIDHNLQHGTDNPWFQRKVMYQTMPADVVPAFKKAQFDAGAAKKTGPLACQPSQGHPQRTHFVSQRNHSQGTYWSRNLLRRGSPRFNIP